MNIEEELEMFRDVLSEDDHLAFGLKVNGSSELRRKMVDSGFLNEDDRRSDSEVVFFFKTESDAKRVFESAHRMGLVGGEVILDPAVDPSLGVGSYALKFAPHVKVLKPEVMYHIWTKCMAGSRVNYGMYEEWMASTGGNLCASVFTENVMVEMGMDGPLDFGGADARDGVGRYGSMRLTVHDLSRTIIGKDDAITDRQIGHDGDIALRALSSAASGNFGDDHDFVNDGNHGATQNGGAGVGVKPGSQSPGVKEPGSHKVSNLEDFDSLLAEELRGIIGIDEIRGLIG